MPEAPLHSRRQMADMLEERMNRTYESLSDAQELEPDSALVKSFIVETDLKADDPRRPLHLLQEVWSPSTLGSSYDTTVHSTDEEELLIAEARARSSVVRLFIDVSNPRYWLFHSMSESTILDRAISRIVARSLHFDRVWFPTTFLRAVSRRGQFRGLGLDFDKRILLDDEDEHSSEQTVAFLKMQLWGNRAHDILALLEQSSAFPHETTLAKVRIKYWFDEQSPDLFSLDDVKFDGKVTARGTSFQSHLQLLNQLIGTYFGKINRLEASQSIRHVAVGDYYRLEGGPIVFRFTRALDTARLAELLSNGGEPFRIWGAPVSVTPKMWRIRGVDLHIGSAVTLEIMTDTIRLYLPDRTCANSVLRLFTNLQHYVDAQITASSVDEEDLFAF